MRTLSFLHARQALLVRSPPFAVSMRMPPLNALTRALPWRTLPSGPTTGGRAAMPLLLLLGGALLLDEGAPPAPPAGGTEVREVDEACAADEARRGCWWPGALLVSMLMSELAMLEAVVGELEAAPCVYAARGGSAGEASRGRSSTEADCSRCSRAAVLSSLSSLSSRRTASLTGRDTAERAGTGRASTGVGFSRPRDTAREGFGRVHRPPFSAARGAEATKSASAARESESDSRPPPPQLARRSSSLPPLALRTRPLRPPGQADGSCSAHARP